MKTGREGLTTQPGNVFREHVAEARGNLGRVAKKKFTWEQMKRVQCFKGEAQDGPTENGINRTEIRLHRLPEREQPSDLMPHYI